MELLSTVRRMVRLRPGLGPEFRAIGETNLVVSPAAMTAGVTATASVAATSMAAASMASTAKALWRFGTAEVRRAK
jgi:hypothetical protein